VQAEASSGGATGASSTRPGARSSVRQGRAGVAEAGVTDGETSETKGEPIGWGHAPLNKDDARNRSARDCKFCLNRREPQNPFVPNR
jgi:hypothetical protein